MKIIRFPIVLIVALLAACAGDSPALDQPNGGAATELTVRVKLEPDKAEPAREGTLTCGDQPSGTGFLADNAAEACRTVQQHKDLLIQGPAPDRICTEIYGGPEVATVTGSIDGQPVNSTFKRTNGCEISDWEMLQPLLGPPASGSGEPKPIS